jgi:dienelactone hydrolase
MIVVKHDDTYYMFAEGKHDIAQLLTSADGIHWTLVGPLDIRLTDGQPISAGPRGTPTAYFENDTWYLFYERRDLGIWLATSKDTKVWRNVDDEPVIKLGPNVYDDRQIAMNQIVKHNGYYYAYFHGSGHEKPRLWSTNVAVSKDLVHWTKYRDNPLLPIEDNKSSGILVHDGKQFRLYTMHAKVEAHFPSDNADSKNVGEVYFDQNVADSNPLRTEQANELDEYVKHLAADRTRFEALFQPDYSSTQAFEKSTESLRATLCQSIGYPPPGERPKKPATFKQIGEDAIGTYFRTMIEILPGVHSEGLYIVPKSAREKRPLVISMHGGGGSPEVALFNGGANYHDMVRGAVKRGYVVYAPQHLFRADGYPQDIRRQIDDRMRMVGTSITAVEIAKITFAIDKLLERPEVDPDRIAMVGLSYGGYYAQMTPALDTRIKVSVSSCYFGVQEGRYEQNELSVPTDFRFMNRMTLFNDADVIALICPRAHQVQAGSRDNASHREKGRSLAPRAAVFYEKLGLGHRFQHVVFEGGHEFHDASAWAFVEEHL